MSYVYLLYKERGDTSFQAIRKLQKNCVLKKVGHCGTLDKFAEGLLIVVSGAATKLAGAITGLNKSYIAEIEFGRETDTLDPNGRMIREAGIPEENHIYRTLEAWLGKIEAQGGELLQEPPAFSAIHSNGKRLYQKALAGENLNNIPKRRVKLHSCKVLNWQAPILKVELHCSKGFYVRSFARDLAVRCASVGHLCSLVRSSIGSIRVEQARTIAEGPIVRDLVELLLQLEGQLKLTIWQTGRNLYQNSKIPAEDWKLLCQGRVPNEIFRSARRHFGLELTEAKEFALLDQGRIIGLFRYQAGNKGPSLKFWHNFCA